MTTSELVVHGNGKTESAASFVRRTMFRGVPDDVLTLTMLMATRYNLDAVARHIVVIEFKGKYQPYITRDGLLHVAHMSGNFDGISATYGKDDVGEFAEATVWRKDMTRPFVYRAYRREYDTGKYTWASHPIAMTTKTAEVIALRRAFDVALTAREEMDAAIERDAPDGAQIIEAEYVPDPELVDPPMPETPADPPATPRGNGKAPEARFLTKQETRALYDYAKACTLTQENLLVALDVPDITWWKAVDPLTAAKRAVDAWLEQEISRHADNQDQSDAVTDDGETFQPALLDDDAEQTKLDQYGEGA